MKLTATGISKTYGRASGPKAVDNVTMSVAAGEFNAVVGESGSGKSTVARIMLGLIEPDEGTIALDDQPLTSMRRRKLVEFRRNVQCILQDPSAALNPRKSVGSILAEVIRLHKIAQGHEAVQAQVLQALETVSLNPAAEFANRLPHQLSGGQRQRVLIARAVVMEPQIIIADEAVSALDISVKAGILNLLNKLRQERNIGYLFITHDLPVVRKVADYVYVMEKGKLVEGGTQEQIFADPKMPYTRDLLAASPTPDPKLARQWLHAKEPAH